MTLLKILQGSGQIGGNIVLIEGKNSKLIFDFGIPLTETDGREKLDYFIKKCKNPNYLILEGTTLNRSDKKQKTKE